MDKRGLDFICDTLKDQYSYKFEWLGRPIIQYPQDIVGMQEIIWNVRPDLIIETGIAHGGSLIFSASMLALLDMTESIIAGETMDPSCSNRMVIGIDIDIRAHNKSEIEAHPMYSRIKMIEGSSIDPQVVDQVHREAARFNKILVCLDSNHTHAHVLKELEYYAPLVSENSYCVVFDSIIEDMPENSFPNRPWDKGNSPKTALKEFLLTIKNEKKTGANGKPFILEIDKDMENKLIITVAPDGFLKRI